MPLVPANPAAWALPARCEEDPDRRTGAAKVFIDRALGRRIHVISRHLHFRDDDGTLAETDPRFVLGPGGVNYVADRGLVAIVATPQGLAVLDRSSRTGLRWLTPSAPEVSERAAVVRGWQGLDWTYELRVSGLKLVSSPVPAPLGVRTYVFPFQAVDLPAPVEGAGGVLTLPGFVVPRAVAIGADGRHYPCGPWQSLPNNRVGFRFDDGALPPAAFPYVLDPTTTITVAATGDDGDVLHIGASWPPAASSVETTIMYTQKAFLGGNYFMRCGLIRFDSSVVGAGNTISSAKLRMRSQANSNADSKSWLCDYYAASNWPIDTGDTTETATGDAHAGIAVSSISTAAYNDLTLLNPDSNINKTGYTGFRHTLESFTPTGNNSVQWYDYDVGSNRPQLQVVTPDSSFKFPKRRWFVWERR